MKAPRNYSDWIECFDRFKDGISDEEIILKMENGSIEWTRGVAERFTESLYETIKYRLNQSADILQKELDRSNGDESAIVKALLSARKRLALLNRLVNIEAFPEQVKEAMSTLLSDYAKDTQKSLEESAQTDRTGRLRMLMKNNGIVHYEKVENIFSTRSDVESNPPQYGKGFKPSKRRVILR